MTGRRSFHPPSCEAWECPIAFCRQYGVLRLDLFGSAAIGACNEATSDLDFVATFADTQKPGYAMRSLHFAEALEALFGRSVDLITDGSIRNPYFQEEVDATRRPRLSSPRRNSGCVTFSTPVGLSTNTRRTSTSPPMNAIAWCATL